MFLTNRFLKLVLTKYNRKFFKNTILVLLPDRITEKGRSTIAERPELIAYTQ